jgi:hypothetical protein
MSVEQAKRALEAERASLQAQIDQIDAALAALAGGSSRSKPASSRSKSGARRGKTSRADLTQEEALERYGAEALTCPECGKISRAPQGMKAHLRSHAA